MSKAALRVDGINVLLGGRPVLKDVSFDASYGEVFSILGPNGAGKSTLLKAIAGLLPYEGQVHVDGIDLENLASHKRADHMAYVPQRSMLASPIPVADVIAQAHYRVGGLSFAHNTRHRSIEDAMVDTDIEHLADRPFTKLSGGEQRRVLLARAIATGAKMILLDEPTASLDIAHALSLYRMLRKLADDGYSIVAVLHDLDHASQMTDRALLLKDGSVVASGASKSVISAERVETVYGVKVSKRPALSFELGDGKK